jgi:SAM-dependent methyltransferase
VTAIELLEHLPAPNEALALAARLLRPGGLFYLTTPNARSLNSRLLGARWSAFAPPEHRTIWSPDGLRKALSAHGLRPEHIASNGLNPYDLLQTLRPRHRAQPHGSTGRVEHAYLLNASLSSSPLRRALKRSINAVLSVAGLGDTLKVWATLP